MRFFCCCLHQHNSFTHSSMSWRVCVHACNRIFLHNKFSLWESVCPICDWILWKFETILCRPTSTMMDFFSPDRCHDVNIFIEKIPLRCPAAMRSMHCTHTHTRNIWKWHIQFLINTTRHQKKKKEKKKYSFMWYMINYILFRNFTLAFKWCIGIGSWYDAHAVIERLILTWDIWASGIFRT